MSPGKVLRRLSSEQGEFSGKNCDSHNLSQFLCVRSRWIPPPKDTEKSETLSLGVNPGTSPDCPDRESWKGD